MSSDQTKFIKLGDDPAARDEERRHCLELVSGDDAGRRFVVPAAGVAVGRTAPADLIFAEDNVSRLHCRLEPRGDDIVVIDLGSTNGTFINGWRIDGTAVLPIGATLKIGRQLFKHEVLTHRQLQKHEEEQRHLDAAASYVAALLPPPISDGPICADWVYRPSSKLGGDAFGYDYLTATQFVFYLIDVSGHGAGAAMHSVAVMNLLRQRALPATDMADPAAVLATLNALFQMERHADMYFTMWYGVFDTVSRRLDFAAAGHHPAFMVPAARGTATPLGTRNSMIGALPNRAYKADSTVVPRGAAIYLFSDGVFEIITKAGAQWGLTDLLPQLIAGPADTVGECERLLRFVRDTAQGSELDDDFSLVLLTFS